MSSPSLACQDTEVVIVRRVTKAIGCLVGAILVVVCSPVQPLAAFDLRPTASPIDRLGKALKPRHFAVFGDSVAEYLVDHFSHPVHEEITERIYGCNGDSKACSDSAASSFAPEAVIAGVRWNDNPPFQISTSSLSSCPAGTNETIKLPDNYAKCWYALFKDARRKAAKGEYFRPGTSLALIYRVHFGDMQFLHSMASWDGESAGDTRKHILMWARFAYEVALGSISPSTLVKDSGVPGMDLTFARKGWSVENLFSLGDPSYRRREEFREFAFGTLLHMVEDSFAAGHAQRVDPTGEICPGVPTELMPGRIQSFHAYNHQDPKLHGRYDGPVALAEHRLKVNPNVVSVGKVVRSFFEAKAPWSQIEPYIKCVYSIEDPDAPAGPGDAFK